MRDVLTTQLKAARAQTDALFDLVTAEGLYERPVSERHRLIFYVGHLETFDWNLLCRDALGHDSLNPTFERLFAFGIDPTSGNVPTDGPFDWPGMEALQVFIKQARAAVDEVIAKAPLQGWLEEGWAPRMAIEHRLMHAETLCYLLQRLDPRFKKPGPLPDVGSTPVQSSLITIPAGVASLGLSRAAAPFRGWDNEYERNLVDVPAFRIENLPVSNTQWLSFIEAGGYRERSLWSDDDWAWLQREHLTHPAFWRFHDGRWFWLAMFGEVPLPGDWPVYVSHAEASAYAKWKQARLPTEPQWHRAAFGSSLRTSATPMPQGNFGSVRFDPEPSGRHGPAEGAFEVHDLRANGWEWTSTVFAPFPGFTPLPFYKGYSADFFDGKHFVIKGASARTDAVFLRPSFRNWFQPHYQHVFAKFRLVASDEGEGNG